MTFIKIIYLLTTLATVPDQPQVLQPVTDTITIVVQPGEIKLADYDYPEIQILSIDTLKTK